MKAPAKTGSKATPSIAELRTAELDQVNGGNPFFILGALAFLLAGDTEKDK